VLLLNLQGPVGDARRARASSSADKCVSMVIMSRSAHTRRIEASSPSLARWGAAAACLGGISYGAWGYLDNPDASRLVIGVVVPVLGVSTPSLFLGGLVGLYSRLGGGGNLLQRAGLLVGLVGTVLGVFDNSNWWESDRWIPLYAALTAVGVGIIVGLYSRLGGGGSSSLARTGLLMGLIGGTVLGVFDGLDWWEGLNWWVLLFAGLTAVGVGTIVEDASRLLGAMVLASGTLGWVSLLTDPAFSGALVQMQPVHVVFAAAFCLSCVAWGWVLFRAVSKCT
jgi:hypothetical protein